LFDAKIKIKFSSPNIAPPDGFTQTVVLRTQTVAPFFYIFITTIKLPHFDNQGITLKKNIKQLNMTTLDFLRAVYERESMVFR